FHGSVLQKGFCCLPSSIRDTNIGTIVPSYNSPLSGFSELDAGTKVPILVSRIRNTRRDYEICSETAAASRRSQAQRGEARRCERGWLSRSPHVRPGQADAILRRGGEDCPGARNHVRGVRGLRGHERAACQEAAAEREMIMSNWTVKLERGWNSVPPF